MFMILSLSTAKLQTLFYNKRWRNLFIIHTFVFNLPVTISNDPEKDLFYSRYQTQVSSRISSPLYSKNSKSCVVWNCWGCDFIEQVDNCLKIRRKSLKGFLRQLNRVLDVIKWNYIIWPRDVLFEYHRADVPFCYSKI